METRTQRKAIDTEVFECLTERRRRLVLSVLHEHVYGVSESDLATMVVAKAESKPLVEVTDPEHDETLLSLHHRHLPKLADAGLLERDADSGTVRPVDHPALRDPGLQRIIESVETPEAGLDAMFEALSSDRRRLALAVLEEACQPLAPRRLAERVAAREQACPPEEVGVETADEAFVDLYHVQLPKLEETGVVARDDGGLTCEGHPALRMQWLSPDL